MQARHDLHKLKGPWLGRQARADLLLDAWVPGLLYVAADRRDLGPRRRP
ncbi:hypothetical protein [Mumia zhuanghuii]|nr:hypothetical protein [Mumia zhuanghuii]